MSLEAYFASPQITAADTRDREHRYHLAFQHPIEATFIDSAIAGEQADRATKDNDAGSR